jgi:hypothetical protein
MSGFVDPAVGVVTAMAVKAVTFAIPDNVGTAYYAADDANVPASTSMPSIVAA